LAIYFSPISILGVGTWDLKRSGIDSLPGAGSSNLPTTALNSLKGLFAVPQTLQGLRDSARRLELRAKDLPSLGSYDTGNGWEVRNREIQTLERILIPVPGAIAERRDPRAVS